MLKTAPEYSIETQVSLVYALVALHNYIRQQAGIEALEAGLEEEEEEEEEEEADAPLMPLALSTSIKMDVRRREMASQMWEAYTTYLNDLSI